MSKKKKKAGGGSFGKAKDPVRLQQNKVRKADWSEVPEGPALTALRLIQKEYADGALFQLNDEFAWAFEDQGQLCFAASNALGEIQPHMLAPGQIPHGFTPPLYNN